MEEGIVIMAALLFLLLTDPLLASPCLPLLTQLSQSAAALALAHSE